MLSQIDNRLKQICQSEEAFGVRSVILVGDIFQLPPVAASALYDKDSYTLQAARGRQLFLLFRKVFLLKENVRQSGDPFLKEVLNSLREGSLSLENYQILQRAFNDQPDFENNKTVLFVTNKKAEAFNFKVIK